MSPQIQSPNPPPPPPPPSQPNTTTSNPSKNRYLFLFTSYVAINTILGLRTLRLPISTARKWEQYETIFKGTTLGAVVAGVAMGGGWNRRRSQSGDGDGDKKVSMGGQQTEKEKEEARKLIREGGVQRD